MLKGKIHRATVTQAELDYVGSIAGGCKFRSKSACNTARRYFQRMAQHFRLNICRNQKKRYSVLSFIPQS